MLKIKSKQIVLVIVDIVLLFSSLYVALAIRYAEVPNKTIFLAHLSVFWPIVLLLIIMYYSFDFYAFSPFQTRFQELARLINQHIFVGVIGFLYFYLFSSYFSISLTPKTILILYTFIAILLHIVWRIYIAYLFMRTKQKTPTLLIAEGEEFEELKSVVNSHDFYAFYFVSHLNIEGLSLFSGEETVNEKLKSILEENNIKQVIIDIRNPKTSSLLPHLYNLASQRKIDVFDALKVYQDVLKKMPMRGVGHFWFFESVHLNIQAYEVAKRVIDVIVAFPILVLYAFVLPFIYVAIKLDDGGQLLSIQRRYGRGGKILNIYKIRTMQFTDDGDWVKHNKTNKVTKVGKFLRKSRLDEFTQLWNVLIGDVSLVGPRPDILANGAKLSAQIPFYMMRYTITPGLSGWAQINQELPPNSLEETKVRLQYDLFYVKNRSLLLDFVIMIKTFKVLVFRTGI